MTIVSDSGAEAGLRFPAGGVSLAVRGWLPTARGVVVTDQVPALPKPVATKAVPMMVEPSNSVSLSPASPVPVMTGVATSVMLSPLAPLSEAGDNARPDGTAASTRTERLGGMVDNA